MNQPFTAIFQKISTHIHEIFETYEHFHTMMST